MKIKQGSAGILTNYEVLELLRSRGASKDPTRIMSSLAPSELKVYDYLVETAACNQTRDSISNYREKCNSFDLVQAEILNILNLRPDKPAILFPILPEFDKRCATDRLEELADMVAQVLPPAPHHVDLDEGSDGNNIGVENENNESEEEMKLSDH